MPFRTDVVLVRGAEANDAVNIDAADNRFELDNKQGCLSLCPVSDISSDATIDGEYASE